MYPKNETAVEMSRKLQAKEVSVREIIQETLQSIRRKEQKTGAFLTVCAEDLLFAQADRIQQRLNDGTLSGLLAGIPVAVKDNICTRGIRTTCASRMLENFIPPYNSKAAELLEKAGMPIIGKTNMDEFAMGNTTETSAFQQTRNPWNDGRVPGGSSGGSCAAVAAGEVMAALGSDTGGSIRQPAAFCGVVGIKPTYGTVSRHGLIAYASSMDQIGPIARNVSDCAALLEVLAEYDPMDATCIRRKDTDFFSSCIPEITGLKIGLPKAYLTDGTDSEVAQAILDAASVFETLGAEVKLFDLPLTEYAVPAYYLLACAEASSNLERFDGIRYGYRSKDNADLQDMYMETRSEGFGPEVRRRILLGTFVLSAGCYEEYYQKAQKARTLISQSFQKAFETYDLLLTPAAPVTAPEAGTACLDPLRAYMSDLCTVPVNLAGLPAVSLPCGFDSTGLPVGMQLIGKHFSEKTILRAAYTYEQASGFSCRAPQPPTEEIHMTENGEKAEIYGRRKNESAV